MRCLVNSISRFIHLVSCQTVKSVPFQKICNNMVGVLKRLKPVLDDVTDYKISLDENLCKACEQLDLRVNEARDVIEKWGPKMSKIHSVSNYWYSYSQTNTIIHQQLYSNILKIINHFIATSLFQLLCWGYSIFRFCKVGHC